MPSLTATEHPLPNGLLPGEAQVGTGPGVVDGDGLALNLVAPAGKVAEGVDGEPHMSLECQSVHCTGVHTLQGGQLLLVLVHQVCQSGERGKRVWLGG